jgi:hypothetical protein
MMRRRLAHFAACLSLLLSFIAYPALAQSTPSRDGLVAFWEQQVKKDPNVVTFEKTKQDGVYNFETKLFPYKGRLKIYNAAITNDSGGEYMERISTGIVETGLIDALPDFYQKYAKSYELWERGGYFYYDQKQGAWFSPAEWTSHYANAKKPSQCLAKKLEVLSGPLGPLLIVVILLLVLVVAARKGNKRVWDRNTEIFENQKRAIANAEEQTKLLQSILEELKKKA